MRKNMRKIDLLVLHHSATEATLGAGDIDGAQRVQQIMRYHSNRAATLGWSKNYVCDYQYLIGPTGKVFEGQPLEQVGFHCGNYKKNRRSIGICFLGNFEKIKMPMEQFNAGVKLIKDLLKRFNIPIENIELHRDIAPTLCPGKHFPFDDMLEGIKRTDINTDVDINNEDIVEYDKAIKFVLDNKIMCPFPDTPAYVDNYMEEPVTKEELAIFLYRLKKLLDREVKITGTGSAKNYNLK